MGRAYNPARIIKSSGVHTFYIGKPSDPIIQAFEAYCIHTEQTFSETCRDMIVIALVYMGFIEDPGIDKGIFLNVGEGTFTPKYYAFRKKAEASRRQQLSRLKKEEEADKSKLQEKTKILIEDDETAFD